jgi:hypothetical protein
MARTNTFPVSALKGLDIFPEFTVLDDDGSARNITNDAISFRVVDAYDAALVTLTSDDDEIEFTNPEGGGIKVLALASEFSAVAAGTAARYYIWAFTDGATTLLGSNRFTLGPDITG